ncbi:hypothetical protein HPP92_021764 [Vanilla planifolia]|uniref:Uncharacterized protein n=1 Tax=Vanilla planifolia TaxID=51239 RepID=A0A835UGL2_VANPL|nr:hypothetical protein HPP92_021764 [Vanilla planifolia]
MASSLSRLSLFSFFSIITAFSATADTFTSAESSDVLLVLQKIKPALAGLASLENIQLSSWNASSPLCLWRGLLWSRSDGSPLPCDLPSVRSNLSLFSDASLQLTSIRLPATGLSGFLPRELGQLSYLRSLNLAVNSLSGPVPLELGNCPALADLDLADNRLNGSLPTSLWNLCDRLVSLRLHGNILSGDVPQPATPNSSCESLLVLDLGRNRFEGEFPRFISGFRNLNELDLSENRFSGQLPESLSELTHLKS